MSVETIASVNKVNTFVDISTLYKFSNTSCIGISYNHLMNRKLAHDRVRIEP